MTATLASRGYRRGPFKTVHSAAGVGELPTPTANAGLNLQTAFGAARPGKVYVSVVGSTTITLENLKPWSKIGSQWFSAIPAGGSSSITHASIPLTTGEGCLFVLDLPLFDRVAFSGTLSAGNVTISIAGVYEV